MDTIINITVNSSTTIGFVCEKRPGIKFLEEMDIRQFETNSMEEAIDFLAKFIEQSGQGAHINYEWLNLLNLRLILRELNTIESFTFYIG